MELLRILQVVTVMNRGGLETMLMNYYRQMDRSSIQFDFLVHREEEGHYDAEIRSLGGRIYRMPQIKPGHYRLYFKQLDVFFAKHGEYQVVHSHMNENSSFVLKAAKKAGVPCRIMHSHLSDLNLDYKLPFRLYARAMMKDNPSSYFACSEKAGEWLFGKQNQRKHAVVVLNNAVDTEQFAFNAADREEIRSEIGAGDKLVIGHIGRFTEQKNHRFLLRIFEAALRSNPHILLVLAGEGPLRGSIEREADRLGIKDSIRFLGVRKDVSKMLQGIDLFLFPSLYEGLPVVLIEAQAAGLPCVVSDRITEESDLTGRLQFVSLEATPQHWSQVIHNTQIDRVDTSDDLSQRGYDSVAMAAWLSSYYKENSMKKASR